MKRLVVVAPTYNERENIVEFSKNVLAQQKKIPHLDLHLIIADSRSPDGTAELARQLGKEEEKLHVIEVDRGIGRGLIEGHRYAIDKLHADYLLQLDADIQHDPDDISRFVEKLEQGYDLVLGSRLLPGGENQLAPHRRIFTMGASLVCRLMMGLWQIYEFTTSYRAFTRQRFEAVDLDKVPWKTRSYVIQPAFLYQAVLSGAKWVEIPIVFRARGSGRSKNQIIRYILDLTAYVTTVRLMRYSMVSRFLIVGFLSWVANAGSLKLFYTIVLRPLKGKPGQIVGLVQDSGLFWSSAVSIEASILVNFFLNENWTFRDRDRSQAVWYRLLKFQITTIGSPIIQFITINTLTPLLGLHYQLSLAIGIILGLFWNWTLNTRIVWRAKKAHASST